MGGKNGIVLPTFCLWLRFTNFRAFGTGSTESPNVGMRSCGYQVSNWVFWGRIDQPLGMSIIWRSYWFRSATTTNAVSVLSWWLRIATSSGWFFFLPLWKIWISQLGSGFPIWWESHNGAMFQSPPTSQPVIEFSLSQALIHSWFLERFFSWCQRWPFSTGKSSVHSKCGISSSIFIHFHPFSTAICAKGDMMWHDRFWSR